MENLQEAMAIVDEISIGDFNNLLNKKVNLIKLMRENISLADEVAQYVIDKIREKSYDEDITANFLSILSPSRKIQFSNEVAGEISKMFNWKVWKKTPASPNIHTIVSAALCQM